MEKPKSESKRGGWRGKESGAGRPAGSAKRLEPAPETLSVRVPSGMKDLLAELAEHADQTQGDYLAGLLRGAARAMVISPTPPPAKQLPKLPPE